MTRILCSASFLLRPAVSAVALTATLSAGLAGCGTARLFDAHPVAQSEASDAPWPRLVDTPAVPPKGSGGIPDPAEGAALAASLSDEARASEQRARAMQDPVLTEADRQRLRRR